MLTIAVQSDNLIIWEDMTLGSTGVVVNDATVSYVLKDAAGSAVSGASGTLTYTGTPGKYSATLESTVSLTPEATYYLECTAVAGGANGFRRIECVAAYQDED